MYFDPVKMGDRIKRSREKRNLTQQMAAVKFNVSRAYYGKIETGSKVPSIELLIEISEFFNISLDYLILGKIMKRDIICKEINKIIRLIKALKDNI